MRLPLTLAVLVSAVFVLAVAQSEAQTTPAVAAPEVSTWVLSFNAQRAYESDVTFSGTEGAGDWYNRLGARLGRDWLLRRGSARLTGEVSQLLYQQADTLNQLLYNVGADSSYALTPRLTWRNAASFNSQYAQDARVLTDAGVLLPRVVTHTNLASTEFSYLLSSRSQIDGLLSLTRITFGDSPLVPGSTIMGRVHLTRELGRSQRVGVSFGHSISNTTGDIEGLLATWQGNFGRSLVLNGSGGIRPYRLDGEDGYRFSPGGAFDASVRLSPVQTFSAGYEYAVEQAYGFGGTHLAHRFNGNYMFAISTRATIDGSASYGYNMYPQLVGYHNDGKTLMIGFNYQLANELNLAADYGLWVRSDVGMPSTRTYRMSLSLTYGLGFGSTRERTPEIPSTGGSSIPPVPPARQ